jgi:membrane protein YqaA with SNARE-associated domain
LSVRGFSKWIVTLFASPISIVVLAALDSTLFFSLPFGIDAAVIILAARLREHWWVVPLLASFGSLAGAALTFWMGVKIGKKGLDRWVPDERRSIASAAAFARKARSRPPFSI